MVERHRKEVKQMKTILKKGIAYFIMLAGVWFLMMGDSLVDKNFILHHRYILERMLTASIMFMFGYYYLSILEARLEKYGRC